jgi:hypothetical protein
MWALCCICSGLLGTWSSDPFGLVAWGLSNVPGSPQTTVTTLHLLSGRNSEAMVECMVGCLSPSLFYRLQFFYLLRQAFVEFHFSVALVRKVHTSL